MDPFFNTLLATAAGGILTLAGQWMTNHYSLNKEREQWERQQRAEKEKAEREEKQKRAAELREIYSDCIHHLSACRAFIHNPRHSVT